MKTFNEFMSAMAPLPQADEENVLDEVGSTIRNAIQKRLIPAIQSRKLTRQQATDLLTNIIDEFKDEFDLTITNLRTSFRNANMQ